jgi:hypothetical protein
MVLYFSDAQLAVIQEHARQVPHEHRPDYLNAIADVLVRLERFSDDDVSVAAQRASACWGVAENPPLRAAP